jgi:hypothetical protein
MKTPLRKRKKQESLAALIARQRSAPTVWLALCDMADERGSRVVTPTREQLRELTGLNEKTISAALTALEEVGWIDRVHKPVMVGQKRVATLLRITLIRRTPLTVRTRQHSNDRRKGRSTPPTKQVSHHDTEALSRNGRSTPSTERVAVEGVNRPKGKGRFRPKTFLRKEAGPRPRPRLRRAPASTRAPRQRRSGRSKWIQNQTVVLLTSTMATSAFLHSAVHLIPETCPSCRTIVRAGSPTSSAIWRTRMQARTLTRTHT